MVYTVYISLLSFDEAGSLILNSLRNHTYLKNTQGRGFSRNVNGNVINNLKICGHRREGGLEIGDFLGTSYMYGP